MSREEQKTDREKRQQIIKTLAVGGLAVTAWNKPIINSVILPAHAQTSGNNGGGGNTGGNSNNGTPPPPTTTAPITIITIPPKPTGLRVSYGNNYSECTRNNVRCNWDNWASQYDHITEIWRNTENKLSTAKRVRSTYISRGWDCSVEPLTTYFYWIRFIYRGIEGPYSESVSITTGQYLI